MTPRPPADGAAIVEALRELARIASHETAPPHVEARLMAAWDHAHGRGTRPIAYRRLSSTAAAAAGIALVATLGLWHASDDQLATLPNAPRPFVAPEALPVSLDGPGSMGAGALPGRRVAPRAPATEALLERGAEPVTFVVVGEPLSADEQVRVVRMRVAASRLAALGVRPVGQNDSVDVELLVGDDGVARGLRFGM